MTIWWVTFTVEAVAGVLMGGMSGWLFSRRYSRRRDREERRHLMDLQLVDERGYVWMKLDCGDLRPIYMRGSAIGPVEPGKWQTLERFGGMALQIRPTFPDY